MTEEKKDGQPAAENKKTGGTPEKKLWIIKSDLMYEKKILPAGSKSDLAKLSIAEKDSLRKKGYIALK